MNLITHLITTTVLLNAAGASEETSQTATISRMAVELRTLKAELLECRLEIQAGKVAWLERELQQAHFDKQGLEAAARMQVQEIREVDHRLSSPELAGDERSELQSVRAEITGGRLNQTRVDLEAAARRHVAIGTQLQAEQQKLQALWQRMTALSKELPQQ